MTTADDHTTRDEGVTARRVDWFDAPERPVNGTVFMRPDERKWCEACQEQHLYPAITNGPNAPDLPAGHVSGAVHKLTLDALAAARAEVARLEAELHT